LVWKEVGSAPVKKCAIPLGEDVHICAIVKRWAQLCPSEEVCCISEKRMICAIVKRWAVPHPREEVCCTSGKRMISDK
jgi:hypothetical protein